MKTQFWGKHVCIKVKTKASQLLVGLDTASHVVESAYKKITVWECDHSAGRGSGRTGRKGKEQYAEKKEGKSSI